MRCSVPAAVLNRSEPHGPGCWQEWLQILTNRAAISLMDTQQHRLTYSHHQDLQQRPWNAIRSWQVWPCGKEEGSWGLVSVRALTRNEKKYDQWVHQKDGPQRQGDKWIPQAAESRWGRAAGTIMVRQDPLLCVLPPNWGSDIRKSYQWPKRPHWKTAQEQWSWQHKNMLWVSTEAVIYNTRQSFVWKRFILFGASTHSFVNARDRGQHSPNNTFLVAVWISKPT